MTKVSTYFYFLTLYEAAREKLERLMQQARDANKVITDAAEELHTKRKKGIFLLINFLKLLDSEDKNQKSEYRADGSRVFFYYLPNLLFRMKLWLLLIL